MRSCVRRGGNETGPEVPRAAPATVRWRYLEINALHRSGRIAGTRRRSLRNGRRNLIDLGRREHDTQGADILLETTGIARARNGHDVVALRQEPGQGELARRAPLAGGDGLDAARE